MPASVRTEDRIEDRAPGESVLDPGPVTAHPTGVVYPVQPGAVDHLITLAQLLQRRSGRLWLGQSVALDADQIFAYLAGLGLTVPFGTGVSLMPLRHPYDAALRARSIATLSGAPYVAGIGPGPVDFQGRLMPAPYPRPVSTAREYISVMRALLDGTPPQQPGGRYDVRIGLPEMAAGTVELGLGVLRTSMARAAGALADVAITWLTPAGYVRDALLPAMASAAAEAGRTPPRVATVVHVAVARPGRDIRRTALAAARHHLGAPHYLDMLRRAGLDVRVDDPAGNAGALVDAGVFVTGTPDEIAGALAQHRRCGIDEVVLNLAGVQISEGVGAAMTDLRDILDAEGGHDG